LLFSKADTYSNSSELFKKLQEIYTNVGYTCMQVSAINGMGIEALKSKMKGKVSMFSGHSGVGKSTLINALEPALDLRTKEISAQHMQGQHTTTFAEMYDLHFEAKIIDTPGIRGFGIVDMENEEICDYFPELFKIKPQCKFNNCMHKDEPNCAVKKAVENGQVATSRYKSYLQILEGDDETYRTDLHEKDLPNWL
jgi:ribosome biogenesis GTPase